MNLAPGAPRAGTPALVVIGGPTVHCTHHRAPPRSRQTLLRSLPAASRVLAMGVERPNAASVAGSTWHSFDGTAASLDRFAAPYDLIVLADGLDALDDPPACLTALRRLAAPHATLAIDVANHATLEMLQRFVEADLTDGDSGALAQRALRLGSMGSAYKLMLDAGWMPTLVDTCTAPSHPAPYVAAAQALAAALHVPVATAMRQWSAERLIVHAQASFEHDTALPRQPARFTVVVPTTRDLQLRLNVEPSPGLREVAARIVSVRGAATPADALSRALEHSDSDWILLCHQDVYFPQGFGDRLNAVLAAVPDGERTRTLIGFAGIGVDRSTQACRPAGFVIDRTQRADWGASDQAVSIDELALVLSRDSLLRIEPAMGWHLWATDLCLQAICTHQIFPRIVRMPLFHNSTTDHQLPDAFHRSAAVLAAKHAGFRPIHTLCGVIDERFLAQRRSSTE